jgi:hypothetical protein
MKIKIETEKKPGTGGQITWLAASANAAIQAALDAVNGKAEAFTVCCANRVYELSLRAEDYLEDNNVSESDRAGATVTYRPAGPQAAAYKNAAISTTVTLSRTASGWYLTDVKRTPTYPRAAQRFLVTITDRAAANLLKRTLKAFGREPQGSQQQAVAA